jgi:transglutaminase-like putative cysteine protease
MATTARTTPRPDSDDLADYLAADAVIDHQHPAIREAVARLRADGDGRGDGGSDVEAARAAFTFVRDEVAHSRDLGVWSGAYRASDVLREGNAVCHGKAHLLAALLRAQGVPVGLCYQRLGGGAQGEFFLHGFVAVHLDGRWVRLDPRGNRPGIDARFSLTEERLAYSADPGRGEIDYPVVHAAVPPGLLAGLASARPGVPGFAHIPGRL